MYNDMIEKYKNPYFVDNELTKLKKWIYLHINNYDMHFYKGSSLGHISESTPVYSDSSYNSPTVDKINVEMK